ncbi:MAG: N(4)-(beta-N-acetylglucosaminyl)-L-asparaginase [Chloroflexi bacterium]|nr:N(4)-(beta-N-acetylglucosaminyl)-L-asparaginase [Chloroflexota bacterium]
MIVVASANGGVGIREAMRVLKSGGSAIDAVEAGIRLVESNPDDDSVGYGGLPNILGEVELDASIMDGKTLAAGCVGAIKGYGHPISVARKVMERLPHVLLVGAGANRFAAEMGFAPRELLTDYARDVWLKRLEHDMPADVRQNLAEQNDLWKWVELATDPERAGGTVNFIAQDGQGNICTGVSTSGWAWKYPGRLGDSPIIGAGNYAHNRYGAAACTGMGEMAIRSGTARSVVLYMKMGKSIEEAGRLAMDDLDELGGKYLSRMNIIALDKDGRPAAFSNYQEAKFTYMTGEMQEPVLAPRQFVATHSRWG